MVEPHRLKNAPITEALVDLHVLGDPIPLPILNEFHAAVREEFPEKREMIAVQFSLGSLPPTSQPPATVGLQLWSSDRVRVLQARNNGLSYSHLRPYDCWESLLGGARKTWEVFRRITGRRVITRFAVRYINRLELPRAGLQFEEYLHTFPKIADPLPQVLAGLFMRLVLPRADPQCMVIVTEAFDPPSSPESPVLPFILDIDTYVEAHGGLVDDEAWRRLEALRAIKNDVFFNCLTPKGVELFE